MLDLRLTEEQYLCLVDDLLMALAKETEQTLPENLTIKQKRWLIDALLEMRAPGDIDETLLDMQNKLLGFESLSRNVKKPNQFKFSHGVATINCDLREIGADVCVLFSPELVCELNEQNETEKQILNAAGVQVKEAFSKIMQENHNVVPLSKAYMVDAGNVAYKKIAKIKVSQTQNLSPAECASFDLAIRDLARQMHDFGFESVVLDLKTLNQTDPALVEIIKREFKQFKKLKIKILKNI